MKTVIHVHQQLIRQGRPSLIIRTYQRSTHHAHISLDCPSCGHHVGDLVQTSWSDSCGAKVTLRTDSACVTAIADDFDGSTPISDDAA